MLGGDYRHRTSTAFSEGDDIVENGSGRLLVLGEILEVVTEIWLEYGFCLSRGDVVRLGFEWLGVS